MLKRHCYVDESGGDTTGKFFEVAVITFNGEKDGLTVVCLDYEAKSGKGRDKWGRAEQDKRLTYMTLVANNPQFIGVLRYQIFRDTRQYDQSTIEAIGNALLLDAPQEYKAFVRIDALSKTKKTGVRAKAAQDSK